MSCNNCGGDISVLTPGAVKEPKWGGIAGSLANQSDLVQTLDNKAQKQHQHALDSIDGLADKLALLEAKADRLVVENEINNMRLNTAAALSTSNSAQTDAGIAMGAASLADNKASSAASAAVLAAASASEALLNAAVAENKATQAVIGASSAVAASAAAQTQSAAAQLTANTAATQVQAVTSTLSGLGSSVSSMQAQVAALQQGLVVHPSQAALLAYVPGTGDPKIGMVTNDADALKRGYYAWDGDSWEKALFDPLVQSLSAVANLLPNAGILPDNLGALSWLDFMNQSSLFGTPDGRVFIDGLQNFVKSKEFGTLGNVANILDGATTPLLMLDTLGQAGIDATPDGRVLIPGLQNVVRPADIAALLTIGGMMSVERVAQLSVSDNVDQSPIFDTPDGRVFIPGLQGYATKAELLDAGGGYSPWAGAYWIVLAYGQSNALGTGTDVVSTRQPYNNKMLNNAKMSARPGVVGDGYVATALVPLKESSVETITSVVANELTRRILLERVNPETLVLVGAAGGNGGTEFSKLSKGNAAGWFEKLESLLNDVCGLIRAQGKQARVFSIHVREGEADTSFNTSTTDYIALQTGFLNDFQESIRAKTGYAFDGPLVFNQCCATHSYPCTTTIEPKVAIAQLDMALHHPRMVMSHPDYINARIDMVHYLTNHATRSSAYCARAAKYWAEGKKFLPLHVTKAEWFNDHVDLTYHVPYGKLEIDTTILPEAPNKGFDLWAQDAGSLGMALIEGGISSVQVIGINKVRVGIVPSASNYALTYAWGRPGEMQPVAVDVNGRPYVARGNIRDTHGNVDKYSNPAGVTFDLHNFAAVQPAFIKE